MITQTEQKIVVLTQAQFNARQSTGTLQEGVEYKIIGESESASNKVTSISSSSTNVQYPSAKCVYDELEEKYTLPQGGIPKTDLASSVQTSLDKAETALTESSIVQSTGQSTTSIMSQKATSDAIAAAKGSKIYGFYINSNESNPSTAVTYIMDAVGMTPAYMDYANDVFNFGSWGDAFFIPRPCMLKSDGTLDYYLDENDYTKKADGTASDISNTSYDGNAMMQWGRDGKKIWVKVVPDSNNDSSAKVYIADYKVDSGFHAWSFINSNGDMVNHFYTPIYNGSVIDGKLRSISGQTIATNYTASQEISYARANYNSTNPIWNIDTFCDVLLINYLLILIGKSLDTQTVFGFGNISISSSKLDTGTLNNKGLFYGVNGDRIAVKVFGMENWWANVYRRTAGLFLVNGVYKYKLCYGQTDGSSADDYNIDGTGYINGSASPGDGYVKNMKYSIDGAQLPNTIGGSSSQYYADYYFSTATGTFFALRGGVYSHNYYCGAFFWVCELRSTDANGFICASPSCKPLS